MPVTGMAVNGRRLSISPELRKRAMALTGGDRPGTVPMPGYIGRPQMVLITDSHGQVHSYLTLYEALPSTVKYGIDLGDKVDRGPNPLEMNYLLQTLRVRRTLGNHDAMWLAAGLGIPAQSIELVRWLMRYNEVDFLTSIMGVNLRPLSEYAERHFPEGAHRVDVKSKKFRSEEAAATYLKIIAEAPVRFPEHRQTVLGPGDLRIRKALFFKEAASALTPGERDIFSRLTGGARLGAEDRSYFYRLMGGRLREGPGDFDAEEQAVIDHFTSEFLNNYEFYRFVHWMIGNGDLFVDFGPRHGYPIDILATHATVPVTETGELAPFLGKTGRSAMLDVKHRIQLGMEAWRQRLEHGDPSLMEMHRDDIHSISLLPWDKSSPLYAREMQTAARAVLQEATGAWDEPKGPFYTHFETGGDKEMVARARVNIARSFGFVRPERYVIVNGHEPTGDGMFGIFAGGTVVRIDGGMAEKYGGRGGALVFGTRGAAWLAYPSLEFTEVPLPGLAVDVG